jgi:CBS domain-containing protein
MADLHCGAILVLDGGKLRGVFSERDIMHRVVLERRDPETTPVKSVMSTQLATIEETASLEEAMAAMTAHSCRHLPVMKDGRVAAFLSMRDLMKHELALKTEELDHMHNYVRGGS